MKKIAFPIFVALAAQVFAQTEQNDDQLRPAEVKLQSVCKAVEISQHRLSLQSSLWPVTPICGIRYGKTEALELGELVLPQQNGTMELTGLEPATIYYIQPFGVSPNGVHLAGKVNAFATASFSSGIIRAYFNNPVAPSFANPTPANYLQGELIVDKIIDRIAAWMG